MSRMRCESCKAKGNVDFRIIYIGGSGEAMLGASQISPDKTTQTVLTLIDNGLYLCHISINGIHTRLHVIP